MIDLALAGTAHCHIGQLAKSIEGRDGVRVKYVWDPEEERASVEAQRHNAKIVGLDRICEDETVSGAVVYSETFLHPEVVTRLAQAGKAVFVEKPLAMTGEDALTLARTITAAGVLFQMGYFMRGSATSRFIRDRVERGFFGQITRAHSCVAHSGALRCGLAGRNEWMTEPEKAGGGGFLDLGTHALDLLLWLLGYPEVAEATGVYGYGLGAYDSKCDECGEGLLRFRNGCLGSIGSSWDDVGNPVSLQIRGTEGYAVLCQTGLLYKSEKEEDAIGDAWRGPMPEARIHPLDAFIEHLEGNDSVPLISVDEAAAASSVMEAMCVGAEERKWVAPAR